MSCSRAARRSERAVLGADATTLPPARRCSRRRARRGRWWSGPSSRSCAAAPRSAPGWHGLELLVAAGQLGVLDHAAAGGQQLLRFDRLHDDVGDVVAQRFLGAVEGRAAGQHDHRRVGALLAGDVGDLQAEVGVRRGRGRSAPDGTTLRADQIADGVPASDVRARDRRSRQPPSSWRRPLQHVWLVVDQQHPLAVAVAIAAGWNAALPRRGIVAQSVQKGGAPVGAAPRVESTSGSLMSRVASVLPLSGRRVRSRRAVSGATESPQAMLGTQQPSLCVEKCGELFVTVAPPVPPAGSSPNLIPRVPLQTPCSTAHGGPP
jgi:hypothetical protein